jgi:ribose transport system permease protein
MLPSQSTASRAPNSIRNVWSKTHGSLATYMGVGGVLVLAVAYLTLTQPTFATWNNLASILETNAALMIVAVGLTFVLIVGGFDLSVGGMLALSGVLLARMIEVGVTPYFAMILVVIAAVILGLVTNGLLVGKIGLSFFVVTLGTMSLFRGTALLLTNGESQGLYEVQQIKTVGSGSIIGIPITILVAGIVFVIGLVVMRYTGFGRMLYAVGGNAQAARIAGIRVSVVRVSAYTICAGLAGLAGVIWSSRLVSASPTAAMGIELTAAAAVLLGGTSFAGGQGGLFGTLLGVLFLGVLSNGLTISGVSSYWQSVVTGAVLIIAVLLDHLRSRRERRGVW